MNSDSENSEKTKNVGIESLEQVKILYKYSEFNDYAYRRLLFREFYFPDRNKLNDLYDLSLHSRKPSVGTTEEMIAYHKEVKNHLMQTSKQTGRSITEINNRSEELKKKISENPIAEHNLRLKTLNEKMDNVGILSLTADRWNDSLMWAHYAKSNTGLCIGINAEKLFAWLHNRLQEGNNDIRIVPFIVKYINGYSDVDFPNIYVRKGFNTYIEYIFTHKYIIWEYEREVRLIMTKDNNGGNPQLSKEERTIQLPPNVIEEVYVGAKCSEADLTIVKNALAITKLGTKLYQMQQGNEQFILDRVEIPY